MKRLLNGISLKRRVRAATAARMICGELESPESCRVGAAVISKLVSEKLSQSAMNAAVLKATFLCGTRKDVVNRKDCLDGIRYYLERLL